MPFVQVPNGYGSSVIITGSDGAQHTYAIDQNGQINVESVNLQTVLDTTGGTLVQNPVDNAGATGARPNATGVGVGTQFYDSTLSKPVWSDGTVWRDATGAAV